MQSQHNGSNLKTVDLKDSDLTETCISSEIIASGGMLTAKRDQVRLPNGKQSQREYIIHPGAVLAVPILPNGNILFERQFRYPLNQVFIELPAGKIDPNETPLETGKRELLEETGYTAKNWVSMGLQHPCIGYSNEVIHNFLALDLSLAQHKPDEDEALQLFELSMDEALLFIKQGKITDAKTIIALYQAHTYLRVAV